MSSFFSFCYDDCVKILTDSAWLDHNGILVRVTSKVFSAPVLPISFTFRGDATICVDTLTRLSEYVDQLATFDTVDSVLPVIVSFFSKLRHEGHKDAEFLIGLFSEASGPQHFYVALHDRSGFEPFTAVNPAKQISAGAEISWNDIAESGAIAEDLKRSDFPDRFGHAVMNAMRKPAKIPGSDRKVVGLGGFVELTTITRLGAATKRIFDYNDVIGKPLPASVETNNHGGAAHA